ncbi:pilus (MSHA type) biogenesis protein MshL [Methylobacillus arboreus]|uniref:pilus (MSHA type) biogenesis protein MshL n=1 Tax=Methylobacillus arboreus TaxID=755170 RepID=UPI001E5752AA|nr:pilus (MSHA type) biogenesis protein MshL [Methylobacillus arboreus]MCB5190078.1 pilus (MSHA type) biogenesis protein MshL [Methylobacillus arboreus]
MSGQLPKVASILILPFVLGLTSCAHQSTVSPSGGHIDEQVSATPAQAAAIPKPVKSSSYLPPPKPRTKEQTYSVVVNDVPVKEILFALARESKLNIDIHPAIQGRATFNAVDQTLPAILERLAKQVDLTYRVDGNVLSITPDMPVLRSYKVDYVNMSRDTTGFIGAAAEIASTGRAAATGGVGGASGGMGASGGGASGASGAANSSRTAVNSESRNHFWETLIQNLKDILTETDKEVIITRTGSTSQSEETAPSQEGEANPPTQAPARNSAEEREQARTEYKTLFAATVIASPETGIISVRATSRQHEKVQEFLDKVMDSAKRQVLIEASIVEVTLNDTYQAGIDWTRLGNGFNMTNQLGLSTVLTPAGIAGTAGTSVPFSVGYSSTNSNIDFSLRLLRQFGDTKVLSSPKLMVLNNQTAVLKVVDNLVYFTIQSQISQGTVQGSANLQAVTTTPNTVPVGVVMSVTPQINDSGLVNINIRPTISRVLGYVDDPNPQLAAVTPPIVSRIPQIQVRELESMLRINSGNTAVLGGLMQDNIQQATDKVPGVSNLPLFGKLFTARSNFNVKTELVIFLRPIVVQNASLESDELSSYKQYLPAQQLQRLINESVN